MGLPFFTKERADNDEIEDDGAGDAVGARDPESEEDETQMKLMLKGLVSEETDKTAYTVNRMNQKTLPGNSYNSFRAF